MASTSAVSSGPFDPKRTHTPPKNPPMETDAKVSRNAVTTNTSGLPLPSTDTSIA